MAILQGTMSDGSLIPVQADSQGRLVCEGLQGPPGQDGAQGPEGPQGPQGPQGEPGTAVWPPDPRPGDVLAWDNGPLWVGGLLPTYPPATGEIVGLQVSTGTVWSKNLSPGGGYTGWGDKEKAFDNDPNTAAFLTFNPNPSQGSPVFWNWSPPQATFGTWRVRVSHSGFHGWPDSHHHIRVNGQRVGAWHNGWNTIGEHDLSSLQLELNWMDGDGTTWLFQELELNGETLYDTDNSTVLTVSSDRDWDAFSIGMTLTQSDGLATGILVDKDQQARTLTLTETTGTWGPANSGLWANGTPRARFGGQFEAHGR